MAEVIASKAVDIDDNRYDFKIMLQNKTILGLEIKWYDDRAVVMSEITTSGTSLTNSIEEVLALEMFSPLTKDTQYFQDCGKEGIFKININLSDYEALRVVFGMPLPPVEWEYFSKDLKTFEVLFGQI